MLVTDTAPFGLVRVSVYQPSENCLTDYGWIRVDSGLEGWTLHKFDWASYIEGR